MGHYMIIICSKSKTRTAETPFGISADIIFFWGECVGVLRFELVEHRYLAVEAGDDFFKLWMSALLVGRCSFHIFYFVSSPINESSMRRRSSHWNSTSLVLASFRALAPRNHALTSSGVRCLKVIVFASIIFVILNITLQRYDFFSESWYFPRKNNIRNVSVCQRAPVRVLEDENTRIHEYETLLLSCLPVSLSSCLLQSILERPATMLAAVNFSLVVDGVAHQVERRIASALRADDGAILAIRFDTSCHILIFLTINFFTL